jgi:hypothetical protein
MKAMRKRNSGKANQWHEHGGLISKHLLGVAAICMVTLGMARTASADDRPIALTESGVVIGLRTNGANEFLGIPYAAPPVCRTPSPW